MGWWKWLLSSTAHRPRRLAFVAVCTRGSFVSIFDYADYTERFLGIRQPLFLCIPGEYGWQDPIFLRLHKLVTDMYVQKYGKRDAVHTTVKGVRNLVHAVMDGRQPHGDAYARVSQSIPGSAPVVPHIVHAARPGGGNLRRALGIPSNATVFARHGGQGQFNLWFAREAVLEVAGVRPDIFFLFLTTKIFCGRRGCPPNVIHLPSSTDRFDLIRTSDAMIHGRWEGETFGLAVAEFATHNRPVITSNRSFPHFTLGRAHLDILGARGIYHYDRATLVSILLGFNRTEAAQRNWLAYTEFEPRPVMQRFWEVFLA